MLGQYDKIILFSSCALCALYEQIVLLCYYGLG